MNITAPAASPELLNELMIDAIAAARPVGTRDPRILAAIRAGNCPYRQDLHHF